MKNTKHAFAARGNDRYETPPCAVRALLEAEPLPPAIWEPACGNGNISKVLEEAGRVVYSADLFPPSYGFSGVDFLEQTGAPKPQQDWAIVTNPPYQLANEFVRHALKLVPKVVMLLRLNFLEGVGRSDIIDGGKLACVYPFRNRLPMMHRDGWEGPKATSSTAFAWYVWDRGWRGPPIIVKRLTADTKNDR